MMMKDIIDMSDSLVNSSIQALDCKAPFESFHYESLETQPTSVPLAPLPPTSPSRYFIQNQQRKQLSNYLKRQKLQQKTSVIQLMKYTERMLLDEVKERQQQRLQQKVAEVKQQKGQLKSSSRGFLLTPSVAGRNTRERPISAHIELPSFSSSSSSARNNSYDHFAYRSKQPEKAQTLSRILPNLPTRHNRPKSAISSSISQSPMLGLSSQPSLTEASIATGELLEYDDLVRKDSTLRLDLRSQYDNFYYYYTNQERLTSPEGKPPTTNPLSNPSPMHVRHVQQAEIYYPYLHKQGRGGSEASHHSIDPLVNSFITEEEGTKEEEENRDDNNKSSIYLPKLLYRLESQEESFQSESLEMARQALVMNDSLFHSQSHSSHSQPHSQLTKKQKPQNKKKSNASPLLRSLYDNSKQSKSPDHLSLATDERSTDSLSISLSSPNRMPRFPSTKKD